MGCSCVSRCGRRASFTVLRARRIEWWPLRLIFELLYRACVDQRRGEEDVKRGAVFYESGTRDGGRVCIAGGGGVA